MSAKASLKIETRHEELDRVSAAVEELAEREGWPPEMAYRVTLVIEELVVNIINHGHDSGVHDIEISLASEPETLTVDIIDDGRPFDPLERRPRAGLGLAARGSARGRARHSSGPHHDGRGALPAGSGQEPHDPGRPPGRMRRAPRSPGAPPFASGRAAAAALAVAALLASASCGGGEAPSDEPAGAEAAEGEASEAGSADEGGPENQAGGTGVSDERILFGQSAAFSGPAEDLGRDMRLGIEASFHEVNQRGGVHGRRLELTALDDAYEPEAAIANTVSLIESEEVFALIGAVGTPTSRSAVPVAAEAGVPYIAPFTGAAFLRDAQTWDNVLNLRASYYQETEEMVARLTEDMGIERIAVMYQDDSFGRAGYQGVRMALDRRGMTLASIGLYTRNTTAVKTALLDLRRGEPEAVIMIGAYQPVATLIGWARHIGMDPIFMTVSFVGSISLAEELGLVGDGVYVSQVVPFPHRLFPPRSRCLLPGPLRLPGRGDSRLRLPGGLSGRPPGHRRH